MIPSAKCVTKEIKQKEMMHKNWLGMKMNMAGEMKRNTFFWASQLEKFVTERV